MLLKYKIDDYGTSHSLSSEAISKYFLEGRDKKLKTMLIVSESMALSLASDVCNLKELLSEPCKLSDRASEELCKLRSCMKDPEHDVITCQSVGHYSSEGFGLKAYFENDV